MADDVIYYDMEVGSDTMDVFRPQLEGAVSAATIGIGITFGYSDGTSFDRMTTSFADFQKDVDDRLVEQGRVGGIVDSMLEALHQRIDESDRTNAGVYDTRPSDGDYGV